MDAKNLNVIALAYMGDAVYEVYIRKLLIKRGFLKVDRLHREAIKYVRASSQSYGIKVLSKREGFLTDEELEVFRRGRNHKQTVSKKAKKNSNPIDDKMATALEAMLGYIYLKGDEKRLLEVLEKIVDVIDNKEKNNE